MLQAGRPDRLGRRRRRLRAGLSAQQIGDASSPARASARTVRRHADGGLRGATPATVVVDRDGRGARSHVTPRYDAGRPSACCSASRFGDRTRRRAGRRRRRQRRQRHVVRHRARPSARSRGSSTTRRRASRSRASSAPTRRRARRSSFDTDAARCSILAIISLSLGDHQPVPVPAARRRPHLLGAGREGPRPRDPVPRHGARQRRRLRARDRSCS